MVTTRTTCLRPNTSRGFGDFNLRDSSAARALMEQSCEGQDETEHSLVSIKASSQVWPLK